MNFLIRLKNEEKLSLIEPSEEIKESYFEKSESNLSSAKILLKNDKLEEAVALTYYSMYNLVIALLFKVGIKSENHTASIILLDELFGIDNSDIKYAKKERIDKQYYTDFNIKKEEVIEAIGVAENFNSDLFDFVSRLNMNDVGRLREKFNNLLLSFEL